MRTARRFISAFIYKLMRTCLTYARGIYTHIYALYIHGLSIHFSPTNVWHSQQTEGLEYQSVTGITTKVPGQASVTHHRGIGRTGEVQRRKTVMNVFSLSLYIHSSSFSNLPSPWETDTCGLQLCSANGRPRPQTSRDEARKGLHSHAPSLQGRLGPSGSLVLKSRVSRGSSLKDFYALPVSRNHSLPLLTSVEGSYQLCSH